MKAKFINPKKTNNNTRRNRAKMGKDAHLIQLINQQLKIARPPPEIKAIQYADSAKNIGSYLSSAFATSGIPLTPYTSYLALTQGTGQGARLGNRIEIKKLRFRGSIRPRAYNVTTNAIPIPQYVRLLILCDEDNQNVLPLPGTDFFQSGSSSVAPDSTMNDIYSVVNTDRWTVYHDQVFKVGYATAGGTGVQVASQSYTNNDFKLCDDFDIDVTRFAPRMYDFDDNTSAPKTKCLSAYFFCCSYDGLASSSATIACNLAFHLDCEFSDA